MCFAGVWATGTAAAAPVPYPVTHDFGAAINASIAAPAEPPAGVNTTCVPTGEHPRPVILINGTHATMRINWSGLGPTLANEGYCVYSAAIGADPTDQIQTCAPIGESIAQIGDLVDRVLRETGARQVDLVGHSQGGLIAEYYTKFHGRGKVANVALLSPTTHGGTASGLATLPEPLTRPGIDAQAIGCPAVYDQLPNSETVRRLSTGPITVPGVNYTVIETRYEFIVTPAPTAAFIDEPGVQNIIVQDVCPADRSGHLLLAYSPAVWHMVDNAFSGRPKPITC